MLHIYNVQKVVQVDAFKKNPYAEFISTCMQTERILSRTYAY